MPRTSRTHGIPTLATMAALAIAAVHAPATAAPLTAIGGYDHYAGPLGQTTDGAVGALVMGFARGDLMLAAVGFDDNTIGRGFSATGGAGLHAGSFVTMRAAATRYVGEGSFRAWRIKAGPQLERAGRMLTLSWTHYRDDAGTRSDGALAEFASPLIARWSGRATAAAATAPLGPAALQGSLGVTWNAIPHLDLSCEVGLARNTTGAAAPSFPARGPLDGLPLIGGGSSGGGSHEQITRQVDRTVLVGMRVTFP